MQLALFLEQKSYKTSAIIEELQAFLIKSTTIFH